MQLEETVEIKGRSIIGFKDGADSSQSVRALNPATGEEIEPPFVQATTEEVNQVAELAQSAFLEYSRLSGKERAKFINEIANQIEALGDTLTQRVMQETGLPEARVKGETGRTTGQLRLFASIAEEGSWLNARIDTAIPDRQPLPKPDVRAMQRPLGPVVVFAASNFPLAFSTAGGDTASALAAGCSVIVKAHSSHPGTAELVGKAVQKAAEITGMPEGVFSLMFGGGRTVGSALVTHPNVKAVGFTGSTGGGTALMKLAAERPEPIPVYAEMGSVNPVFVLPGALAERSEAIANGLHVSATMGVGQFCTNPGVVMLQSDQAGDSFKDAFAGLMDNHADEVMLNRSIQKAYSDGVAARDSNSNVEVIVSGNPDTNSGPCHGATSVFEASAEKFLEDENLSHEIFGPGTTLVRYKSKDDLHKIAENLEGQLTATIHGTDADLEENKDLVAILERKVGRIVFNGFPTGVEVCPSMVHGGPFPATSDGRSTSVGTFAIDRFTRLVAFQTCPQSLLPDELKDGNPLGIQRMVNGKYTRD